jgi:hypothetical protein
MPCTECDTTAWAIAIHPSWEFLADYIKSIALEYQHPLESSMDGRQTINRG